MTAKDKNPRRSLPRYAQGHLLRREADSEGAAEDGQGRASSDNLRRVSRSIAMRPRGRSNASSRSSRLLDAAGARQDLRRDPRHSRGGQGDHGRLQGQPRRSTLVLLAAAQAVEHYEIARYGTLKTWA